MRTFFKVIFLFLAITGAVTLLYDFTNIPFGTTDYFVNHGYAFLFFMALFPRLTLIVSGLFFNSIEFGGFLWWIGFFLAPRLLVAVLATISYWNTNPILVVISWLFALSGESSEKVFISRRFRRNYRSREGVFDSKVKESTQGPVIDAEYTKIKDE